MNDVSFFETVIEMITVKQLTNQRADQSLWLSPC